jgi:hypothetical protein
MADYVSASIILGGKIPEAKLNQLTTAIMHDAAGPEAGETFGDIDEILAYLRAGEVIELFDDQARWGEFEQIQNACHELDLSFRRHNEAKYEIQEEILIWTAETNVFRTFNSINAEPAIPLSVLEAGDPVAIIEQLKWARDFTPPPLEIT